MKPRRLLPTLLLLMTLIIPQVATAKLPTVEERLDSGGIIKDITIPGDTRMAHVTVQAIIESRPAVVWSVLKEIEGWPGWLPMSKEAHFLSKDAEPLITPEVARSQEKVVEIDKAHPNGEKGNAGSGKWQKLAYEEYDLPWPIQNEWVVRRYTYEETPQKMRASWRKIDSTSEDDDGYWEVSGWKDGKTHLRYYYKVKVKDGAPQTLFKAAVNLTVNSMIKALRREAGKKSESPAIGAK